MAHSKEKKKKKKKKEVRTEEVVIRFFVADNEDTPLWSEASSNTILRVRLSCLISDCLFAG